MAGQKQFYDSIDAITSLSVGLVCALGCLLMQSVSSTILIAVCSGVSLLKAALTSLRPSVVIANDVVFPKRATAAGLFLRKKRIHFEDVIELRRRQGWIGDFIVLSAKDGSTLRIRGSTMFKKRFEELFEELKTRCAAERFC